MIGPPADAATRATSVLVTGAAGFIGSHLVAGLLRQGRSVVGLDNFNDYYSPQRKRTNLEEATSKTQDVDFLLVEGDICDQELMRQTLDSRRFDAIIHLAAMAGVRASIERPSLYFKVNLDGTREMLQLLSSMPREDRPHFVFASTSSVYGATERLPFREDDPCDRPLVPYSASKRAAELTGYAYWNMYAIDFTALRFFTVYGPRGRPDMMAFKVAESIESGREVPLYNNGDMYRDWTYVDDIVDGVIAAADRRLGYEIINLGRGEPVRLGDFVHLVQERLGRSANLVPADMPVGDVRKTHADITKARELLGYNPRTSVEQGVARFLEWFSHR